MRRPVPGARMSPEQQAAAARGLKGLIPIAGRPFLDHVIGAAASAGLRDVCLVVRPGDDPIREHYERCTLPGVRISFAVQDEPLGSAHALLAAECFAENESVIVINADNFYPTSAFEALRSTDGSALVGFRPDVLVSRGNVTADGIAGYAIVLNDAAGHLTSIVEKPDAAALERAAGSALVSMTCWKFEPVIFAACREVPRSPRGEHELPDAVLLARRRFGERFRVVPSDDPVLDLSTQADIAAVEAALVACRVERDATRPARPAGRGRDPARTCGACEPTRHDA